MTDTSAVPACGRVEEEVHAQPIVSCVIIFLNPCAFLADTIGSVVTQTFDRLELLLIDDGRPAI